MPATETILDFCGCRLLLRRAGAGPPVLFLHGAGGFPVWFPFFDKLAERFALVVPDHPSFGRSSTPDWLEDMGDLAYFYLSLLKQLDLKGVHVVGHSMGGWLALEMAVRSTARIASLTLIASAGIRIKGAPITNVFIMDRAQLIRALWFDQKTIAQELERTLSPQEIDQIINNTVAAARLSWQPRFFNPKLGKWLHRIDVPTHIVWGAEDRIVPAVYAAEFKRLIPQSLVTMLPEAGHIPFAEKSDETTAAVSNFIMRNA
jgi:pimeloyl-ACP methyl ester carboxylesterase